MSRKEEIVDAARRILEAEGREGVSMRAIAELLEMRAPSLYKHISDKHEVEVALIARGFVEQAEAFHAALATDGRDPIAAIAGAYRTWALANPHLYTLMNNEPLPRDDLPEGVENAAAAPLIDAVDGDTDRARALWALAHGMVSLELADRFPPGADLEAAWRVGLRQVTD